MLVSVEYSEMKKVATVVRWRRRRTNGVHHAHRSSGVEVLVHNGMKKLANNGTLAVATMIRRREISTFIVQEEIEMCAHVCELL